MKRIRVVNWEKFQHYGSRRVPPWIRLYNTLLDKYEWGRLTDASKAHLVGIFLLASRYRNKIPADPKWIAERIQARSRIDLDELMAQGFIEPADGTEGSGEVCERGASLEERRRESEKREYEEEMGIRPARAPREFEQKDSFIEPGIEEVSEYARSIGYPGIKADEFIARYRAVGWRMGQTPITDWRPLIYRWRQREQKSAARRGAGDIGRELMIDLAVEEGLINDHNRSRGPRHADRPLLPVVAERDG